MGKTSGGGILIPDGQAKQEAIQKSAAAIIQRGGGPVTPTPIGVVPGMTLRCHIAVEAMKAIINVADHLRADEVARDAVGCADAMLEEMGMVKAEEVDGG